MKAILLSALLLAALPTAAMAETDLGSVLMENAISYENADARKAEDPLLLLSWPENAESVRYEVEIFKGLPEHLDRNIPLEETVYHDRRIYMNRLLVRIPPVMDGTPLYWRVRPIDADWEGLAPFSAPMEVRSTMRLISRNAPYPKGGGRGNGAFLLYPVYSYTGNPGASSYEVEVTKEYPENIDDARPSRYRVWSEVTTLSNVYDEQPRLGTYYWRVRGIGSDGEPVGIWSLPEKIRNQAAVHFDIGIFGDSITQGGGHLYHSPSDLAYSYVSYLDFPAVNLGRSGDTTEMMEKRFDRDVLPFHVKQLLIMGGINDLRMGADPEKVIKHLKRIQEKCRAHGITPVLMTLLPINPENIEKYYGEKTNENWREAVDTVNAFIRSEEHIDTAAPFAAFPVMPTELAMDGLHGDWNAKQMIAGEINREMERLVRR
uniref:SGNH/GDSL hydrolase family protein n=1 Tax=Dialister sp. TaxID=1955814 RepID=UPI004025389A